jgi:hypothetical protein
MKTFRWRKMKHEAIVSLEKFRISGNKISNTENDHTTTKERLRGLYPSISQQGFWLYRKHGNKTSVVVEGKFFDRLTELSFKNSNPHSWITVITYTLVTCDIDHRPDATIFQFIILTSIYSSICCGRSPAHHQELNDCSSSL